MRKKTGRVIKSKAKITITFMHEGIAMVYCKDRTLKMNNKIIFHRSLMDQANHSLNYLKKQNRQIICKTIISFVVSAAGPVSWNHQGKHVRSDQISSVPQSCPTLCHPINRSTPGLPVHHQLSEFTQTHVHRVGDAIQPSHPLLSPSPLDSDAGRDWGLFQWVNSSHEVAKVLEFQL